MSSADTKVLTEVKQSLEAQTIFNILDFDESYSFEHTWNNANKYGISKSSPIPPEDIQENIIYGVRNKALHRALLRAYKKTNRAKRPQRQHPQRGHSKFGNLKYFWAKIFINFILGEKIWLKL